MRAKSIRKAAGGRPRLFTEDQVIDAAVRLGLAEFTMKRVADELGVSIATLYQYVNDRDDLLRRAVARQMASLPLPADVGQHWSVFLREFAGDLCDMLSGNPHLLVRLVDSGSDMESGVKMAEGFLKFMDSRGFPPQEAMRLMQKATAAAFGAAVVICRDRHRAAARGSFAQAAAEAIALFPPQELPLLKTVEGVFATPGDDMGIELLELLIEKIATDRGDVLPQA